MRCTHQKACLIAGLIHLNKQLPVPLGLSVAKNHDYNNLFSIAILLQQMLSYVEWDTDQYRFPCKLPLNKMKDLPTQIEYQSIYEHRFLYYHSGGGQGINKLQKKETYASLANT